MKMFYIIRGVPGSGKSTLARKLAPNAAFEADTYMVDSDGNYAFDPKKLSEVHQKCYEAVRNALLNGTENVAVANTFVKKWEYQKNWED
jgi:predicted ABC-type ATPase